MFFESEKLIWKMFLLFIMKIELTDGLAEVLANAFEISSNERYESLSLKKGKNEQLYNSQKLTHQEF